MNQQPIVRLTQTGYQILSWSLTMQLRKIRDDWGFSSSTAATQAGHSYFGIPCSVGLCQIQASNMGVRVFFRGLHILALTWAGNLFIFAIFTTFNLVAACRSRCLISNDQFPCSDTIQTRSFVHLPDSISLNCLFTSSLDFEVSILDAFFLIELINWENFNCPFTYLFSVCDVMLVPYSQDAITFSFTCFAISRLHSAKNCFGVWFWLKTAEKASKSAKTLRVSSFTIMPVLKCDTKSSLKKCGRKKFLFEVYPSCWKVKSIIVSK